jgi:hypothetical protein
MDPKLRAAISIAAVVTLSLTGSLTAVVDESTAEPSIEQLLAGAPGADRVLESHALVPDLSVSVSRDANAESIEFEDADGNAMSIGMPSNAEFTDDTSQTLGDEPLVTTQYTQPRAESDSGGAISARAVVVIPDEEAPSSYDFAIEVPPGVAAEPRADGGINLVAPGPEEAQTDDVEVEMVIAQIEPAWAVDANGVSIPTSYHLNGSTLTQSIDFDAVTAFPVVADPEVKWMGYFIRLTYSKAETRGMRDQGVIIAGVVGLGAAIAAAAGPAAPAIVAAVYAASAAAVGIIATTASNAVGDGRCLQLDIPSMIPSIVKCRK